MEPSDVSRVAHNDAYFGLGGAMDTELRSEYMSQDVLMREMETDLSHGEAVNAALNLCWPSSNGDERGTQ